MVYQELTKQQTSDHKLYVDLDGTIIKSDTIFESLLILVKSKPWILFFTPFWILAGKAHFKHQIAIRIPTINAATLPYRRSVLSYLRGEKDKGREIILITGAHKRFAQEVAEHLGLFDRIIASDKTTNVTGQAKLEAIRKISKNSPFEFIGNSKADLHIFREAHAGRVISGKISPSQAMTLSGHPSIELDRNFPQFKQIFGEMRIAHWVKNLLVFSPALAAQQFDGETITSLITTFFGFCFLASAMYAVNDLFDLNSDRAHPSKVLRPLASGNLSIPCGFSLCLTCLAASLTLAQFSQNGVWIIFTAYFFTNILYTFFLKTLVLIDVFILVSFFLFRVWAGAHASNIDVTNWFIAFSLFVFLSLSLVKRYGELRLEQNKKFNYVAGRGYLPSDAEFILLLGLNSAFLSILVLAFYINSEQVQTLYMFPKFLWLMCPILLFWICNVWLLAYRGKMKGDPIIFLAKDPTSYLVFTSLCLVFFAAIGSTPL